MWLAAALAVVGAIAAARLIPADVAVATTVDADTDDSLAMDLVGQ